ncbi:MAG: hypothetical protein KDC53_24330 [Saprospiraceae bacterium]|nr:hypothetical protein [Saprospiraceae bacterium]
MIKASRIINIYILTGAVLLFLFWFLIWHLDGLRSHFTFFPLWLGYILLIGGLTARRKGSSLLTRNFKSWCLLFIFSAPVWWIFEWLNKMAYYWTYLGVESFSDLEYNIFATISFSTVIPAVFSTSEWVETFHIGDNFTNGIKVGVHRSTRLLFFTTGWLMLLVFLLWPKYGAAFLWMSLYFIIDPLNYRLGFPSLLKMTSKGDWSAVIQLWIASLICGFLWEMWNYFAYPKWIYNVPFVDDWHIFEMPALGYLGYLPFSLELYAMYHLITGLLKIKPVSNFV